MGKFVANPAKKEETAYSMMLAVNIRCLPKRSVR